MQPEDQWRALTADEREAVMLARATASDRAVRHEVEHDEFGHAYVAVQIGSGVVLVGREVENSDDATAQDYREALLVCRAPEMILLLAERLCEERARTREALAEVVRAGRRLSKEQENPC